MFSWRWSTFPLGSGYELLLDVRSPCVTMKPFYGFCSLKSVCLPSPPPLPSPRPGLASRIYPTRSESPRGLTPATQHIALGHFLPLAHLSFLRDSPTMGSPEEPSSSSRQRLHDLERLQVIKNVFHPSQEEQSSMAVVAEKTGAFGGRWQIDPSCFELGCPPGSWPWTWSGA